MLTPPDSLLWILISSRKLCPKIPNYDQKVLYIFNDINLVKNLRVTLEAQEKISHEKAHPSKPHIIRKPIWSFPEFFTSSRHKRPLKREYFDLLLPLIIRPHVDRNLRWNKKKTQRSGTKNHFVRMRECMYGPRLFGYKGNDQSVLHVLKCPRQVIPRGENWAAGSTPCRNHGLRAKFPIPHSHRFIFTWRCYHQRVMQQLQHKVVD